MKILPGRSWSIGDRVRVRPVDFVIPAIRPRQTFIGRIISRNPAGNYLTVMDGRGHVWDIWNNARG